MKPTITKSFDLGNFDHISITGFLIPCGLYAQRISLIEIFAKHLKIDMKSVKHSPIDKVMELFVSIIAGCPDNKTINNRLVPDKLAALAWGQEQFADQSQVNIVLHRVDEENLKELEDIYQDLFRRQGLSVRQSSSQPLVIDVDMTGISVSETSRTYEGAQFGYMEVREKKAKGYQFSLAYVGEKEEILGGLLDPGNTHCATKLPDLTRLIEKRVGRPPLRRVSHMQSYLHRLQRKDQALRGMVQKKTQQLGAARKSSRIATLSQRISKNKKKMEALTAKINTLQERIESFKQDQNPIGSRLIIIRGDAGYGTADNVALLFELGYEFVLKGYSSSASFSLASSVPEEAWRAINSSLDMVEAQTNFITGCPYPVRIVLGRKKIPGKNPQYFHLITTLPKTEFGLKQLLKLYNRRQSIEAFIKAGKITLHFRRLRVRTLPGIKFFLTLSLLAYNFITWSKGDLFEGSSLSHIGVREFVDQVMRVPAQWQNGVTLFPENNVYAKTFVKTQNQKFYQLPLFGS